MKKKGANIIINLIVILDIKNYSTKYIYYLRGGKVSSIFALYSLVLDITQTYFPIHKIKYKRRE